MIRLYDPINKYQLTIYFFGVIYIGVINFFQLLAHSHSEDYSTELSLELK